ncbi:hypothetical protein XBLMG947_1085 [Xanthomonas bromi]|uniref:YcgL domain-containing protein XBLMG947_1085 n=4 Tax=Xanthomonas TaxID=338 RepID=A0A1C3NIX2_9XANT|nr:hypothetical protein XBLMG947_1085 [Xanthomonas bromi]
MAQLNVPVMSLTRLGFFAQAVLSPSPQLRHNPATHFSFERDHARMHAYVYKSQRKQDTFVYLATRDDFSGLPAAVHTQLAPFAFVLEVALTPERRLAQADVATVREALGKHGFYLQLPKTVVLAGECDYD